MSNQIVLTDEYKARGASLERGFNMDAAHSAFVALQLQDIDGRIFDKLYGEIEFTRFVKSMVNVNMGAEEYGYLMMDRVGEAHVISDYTTDFPSVDVETTKELVNIVGLGASYKYSIQEARAAAMAGVPLDAKKAFEARDVLERKVSAIMLNGLANSNLKGLFAHSAFSIDSDTSEVTTATTRWSSIATNSGLQIAKDVVRFVNSIWLSSLGNHKANMLIVPWSTLLFWERTSLDAANPNRSVLEYIKANLPGVSIEGSFRLDTASAGGAKRAMALESNDRNLQGILPVPGEMLPEKVEPMFVERRLHARLGGIAVRYSGCAKYIDAI